MDPGISAAAKKSMQDSWVDLPQGKEAGSRGEGGEVEGSLTHSRSQQEMEQLLASAASNGEGSEDAASVPSFTIPEQPIESGVQQVARVVGAAHRHTSAPSERFQCLSRIPGLSWILEGGVANLLFPVLVITHLALFGLGYYIGRRTLLMKT